MRLLLCGVGLRGFVRVVVVNIGCQNRLLAIHASLLLRAHNSQSLRSRNASIGALFQREKSKSLQKIHNCNAVIMIQACNHWFKNLRAIQDN